MAFMIPVMRNDYDIYKKNGGSRNRPIPSSNSQSNRSRKVSESSRQSSDGPSLSTSPNSEFLQSPSHRNLVHVSSKNQFSRVASRTSQSSGSMLITSPTKQGSTSNGSPPKPAKVGSQNSLNKFHNRLVDRLRKAFKSSSSSSSEDSRSWKSHSVDMTTDCKRSSKNPTKKINSMLTMSEMVALEQQFLQNQNSDSDDSDDGIELRSDDKFILI